ncbi:tetratricopeptide repeat protein, partial [Bacteroidota bacterium]
MLKIVFTYIFFVPLIIYSQQSTNIPPDLQTQLNEYNELLTKYQSEGNQNQQASYYNKIAFIYWETENYQDAVEYFQKSLQLNTTIGNRNAIYTIQTNLGMIYSDMLDYQAALRIFENSLITARNRSIKQDIASALVNISTTQQILDNNCEKVITNISEAVEIAKEINNVILLRT